jgi:hypothetical protein
MQDTAAFILNINTLKTYLSTLQVAIKRSYSF